MLLKAGNLQAEIFPDAKSFLETYSADTPGCLLLDVRMPGISGLELQEKLIKSGICLPIILITGHGDVAMAVRAMKAGALDFIEKPFSSKHLLYQFAVKQVLTMIVFQEQTGDYYASSKAFSPRRRRITWNDY